MTITGIPFLDAYEQYVAEGWSPLPLPQRSKFPPPFGWTGGNKEHSGETPSTDQLKSWATKGYGGKDGKLVHRAGNIALRVPDGIIGIDVDMYNGKAGRETLAEYEDKWGILPATWTSGSRSDGSGIRLFRVPKGLSWASRVGGDNSGIEIVRWDHRYVVAPPSIHPDTGLPYQWLGPDWQPEDEFVPAFSELADMPDKWVKGLTDDLKPWVARPEAQMTRGEVTQWMATRPDAEGDLCREMAQTVARGEAEIEANGAAGLHDAVLRVVWGVLRDAANGHRGIRTALSLLRTAFMEAAAERDKGRKRGQDRRMHGAEGEWFRAVSDGVLKVAAELKPADVDSCGGMEDDSAGWEWRAQRATEEQEALRRLPELMFDCSDIGVAQRLQFVHGANLHWLASEEIWLTWNGERWRRDRTGQTERWAMQLPEIIEQEASKFAGDEEYAPRFKALSALKGGTGNRAKRLSGLNDLKSLAGISVVLEDVDANERYLQCGGTLVELRNDGVVTRPSQREDLQTLSTAEAYDEAARSSLWERFLKRSIPDEDTRDWIQRAVGYSLLGRNPERKIFFIKGVTSTGKSVFAEAVRYALGEYAAAFDMTLFRQQKEAGPNVQLVRLMDKRIIVSSETSAERYLHADQLKRITGGDTMSARLNRSNDMVEKVPAFTPWIMTNQSPTIRGADQALYRRLICVPFDEEIPVGEVDAMLGYRLTTEPEHRAAVLAWAVAGWKEYARRGLEDVPATIATSTMQMRGELSEFDIWFDEDCENDANRKATTNDLYAAYTIWAANAGIRDVETKVSFSRNLAARLGKKPSRIRVGTRAEGRQEWGFVGIGLRAG